MVFDADSYRELPTIYTTIAIVEFFVIVFGISVISMVAACIDHAASTTTISEPIEVFAKRLTGIILIVLGSIVPLSAGLFRCCKLCSHAASYSETEARQRMLRRMMTVNCLCPCYIPRPKLRFIVRFAVHIICILLRIAPIVLFGMSIDETPISSSRYSLISLSIFTGLCLIFPVLTIVLDISHCRVWWPYHPDISDIPSDIIQMPFSPKHKGFIPYVLTEQFRTETIGNRKCNKGNNCRKRELEHMAIFHATNYQPQARWSIEYPVYIGFHRTKPESAYKITKSDFRPSRSGMLGPGAYFALSTEATRYKIGQADQIGAWLIAKISMGKVFFVDNYSIRQHLNDPRFDPELKQYVRSGKWADEYDTCYYRHSIESRDEFCIKDPEKQILKWVVVIETPHDRKILGCQQSSVVFF